VRALVKEHGDKDWSLLARYMTTRSAVFVCRCLSRARAFECVCVFVCVLVSAVYSRVLLLLTSLATGVLIVAYILNMTSQSVA
jgi:hypothetical protein